MAGISDRTTSKLLEITGFQRGIFPFCYLGIPLVAEKLHTSNYGLLTEAIMQRLASWPKQTLSYNVKLELVKTVLQGIEYFWLSILPVPWAVIDKIYVICRSFVCSTKYLSISWVAMCLGLRIQSCYPSLCGTFSGRKTLFGCGGSTINTSSTLTCESDKSRRPTAPSSSDYFIFDRLSRMGPVLSNMLRLCWIASSIPSYGMELLPHTTSSGQGAPRRHGPWSYGSYISCRSTNSCFDSLRIAECGPKIDWL